MTEEISLKAPAFTNTGYALILKNKDGTFRKEQLHDDHKNKP
jgi:hypothetical protein